MEPDKKNGGGAGAESTALIHTLPALPSPYEPSSYDQASLMAKDFASSKLTKCRTREQALLIMATGRELGIPATTALRMIYVADFGEGETVALSADLKVALCLRSPLCEYFRCTDASEAGATYETKRRGDPARTFRFDEAARVKARLGFSKDGSESPHSNWAKYRKRMMMHRASSMLADEVFPDVIGGFYTNDEIEDMREAVELRVVDSAAAPVLDAKVIEMPPAAAAPAADLKPAESDDQRLARWLAALDAARAEPADLIKEVVAALKDKNHPARFAVRERLAARKAAGWAAIMDTVPDVEPPHDENGEVIEGREPGEEG